MNFKQLLGLSAFLGMFSNGLMGAKQFSISQVKSGYVFQPLDNLDDEVPAVLNIP